MKILIVALTTLLMSQMAPAENYYVEPMICTGKWNKAPPQYHPSYEQASLKMISFWSVRSKDCSLAPSSSTEANYAHIDEELEVDRSLELSGWIGVPLKKDRDVVTAPYGVWGNEMELKIVSSTTKNGVQTDKLEGRSVIFKEYHYDLSCEATVVKNPKHIENNTTRCP